MPAKAPLAVLVGTVALALAAGGVLLADGRGRPAQEARAREFQGLVGGLGFGPATDLARCGSAFDPRVCPRCPADLGPVAGGGVFCPQHADSLLDYPPLEPAP